MKCYPRLYQYLTQHWEDVVFVIFFASILTQRLATSTLTQRELIIILLGFILSTLCIIRHVIKIRKSTKEEK